MAFDRLDFRSTTAPPVGAGSVRVTVPTVEAPPIRVVTVVEIVLIATVAGSIVRVAVSTTLLAVAVIVAVVTEFTEAVVTENVVDVAPAATLTDAGTTASEVLDLRVTVVPPEGAAVGNVMVPWLAAPEITVDGDRETVNTDCSICVFNPEKMMGPHPVSVSQPIPAFDCTPFGKVPFVPEVTS